MTLPTSVKSILFICTANRSRSLIAAALIEFLQVSYQLNLKIESAGTDALANLPATENTLKILQEYGIKNIQLRSKVCSKEMVEKAGAIFVMEKYHWDHMVAKYPEAQKKIFFLADFCTNIEPWIKEMGIPDPAGMNSEFYKNVFQLIENSCQNILQRLKSGAQLCDPASEGKS